MAGRRITDLLIKIGADSYEFKQKTQQVERDFDSLSKKLDKVGKELSLKLTAPLTALGVVALNNADIQQQAEQRLLTALKGRSDIQQRLIAEAGELQSRSTLGDEAIIGQQAYLASLGMTEEQIGRVIEASAQLSYATGMTLDSAVKNLAKTYGGLTGELGESIPKLKELTTEQLKNGEAVDFILENYKGFAEAAAETGIGPIKQLKNAWGDFLEQIGAIIMPIAAKVAGALSSVVAVLQAMDPRWQKLLVSVAAIAAAIGPLCMLLGSLSKALPLLKSGFAMLVAPIGLVKAGIHSLTAAIAANPIGLLLTLITTGISLFVAFGDSAEDAAEKNGELTDKVIEEARQVNALVGKLSSANTSEQERKAALEELKSVQPQIVEGLSAEALELETLRKRAAEYNQQLVLRIALARKQDQVTAAIERQTEAGVRQAEKEAELYAYLSDIGTKLVSGDFEFGRHNQNKGFYEWKQASEQLQSSLINLFNDIMAGGDSLAEKARRVQQMFQPQARYGDKIRMDDVSMRKINRRRSDVRELGEEVSEAGGLVSQAEAEVRNFAEAFSLSLASAVEDATGAVDGLGGAADGASTRTQKSIAELNEEIKTLETQKQKSFDPTEIA